MVTQGCRFVLKKVFFLYSKAENSRINNFVFLTVDVVLWSNIIEAGN